MALEAFTSKSVQKMPPERKGSRMKQKECVVIGAGLAGLAAAY